MNIVIVKTNTNFKDNKKLFDAMEKLGHNFVGFVALGQLNGIAEVDGYNFYPVEYIHKLNFDVVLIDRHIGTIGDYLPILAKYQFPMNKVRTYFWLLQQIMTRKYENFSGPVIQQTLIYWQTHELSVFNQLWEGLPQTADEVYIDKTCGLPYIIFKTIEGKERRMYYPRESSFPQGADGKKYVYNVLREQVPHSPHLYIKGTHKVDEGDVLIDAGVCEGNFVLRYADICSKMYLFEPDKKWFEPLFYSLQDCLDKVEFVPEFVGETTRKGVSALDDIVDVPTGSKIFLKMDVEGAESAALRGAKKILSTCKVKASVCSYHRADDIIKIKSVFINHGYKVAASDGYMCYLHDSDIWETADFRKGVVYAENY